MATIKHSDLTKNELHDNKPVKLTNGDSSVVGNVVYISAANTISKANATDNTKIATGVVEEIDDTYVWVRSFGKIANVITIGAANIVAGDLLFLSTTDGKVTKTPPASSGNVVQVIGRALTAEASSKVDILLAINFNPMEV